MTVDEVAGVILGFLHEVWAAEALDVDAKISQSGGLHMPAFLASLDLALEDCTPDVLRALWQVESYKSSSFYYTNIDASGFDGTWYRELYAALEDEVRVEAIHYLPGGWRYEELHAERLRKARRG